MNEWIYNLSFSIASGIVSSIIVTMIYRKIDQERDRQNYFLSLRTYISQLCFDSDDLDKMKEFILKNEFPYMFDWIHLSKNEKMLIEKVGNKCNKLSGTIIDYYIEKSKPLPENKTLEDLRDEYLLIVKIKQVSIMEKYYDRILALGTYPSKVNIEKCSECNGTGICSFCNGKGKITVITLSQPDNVTDNVTENETNTLCCPVCGGSCKCSCCEGTGTE